MILWIALVALLALTVVAIARPLLARRLPSEDGDDREVYAAQLTELEADHARGLIADADLAAARAEVARRLLRARGQGGEGSARSGRARATLAAMLLFLPVFSFGAYLALGSPDHGDQPLALRLQPVSDDEFQQLLARAEQRLNDDPDDVEGWLAVAPVYQRLRRFDDAANAYGRLLALRGENAEWLALAGENLAFANGGTVTAEAREKFERALEMEPLAVRPAIFLAIEARQAGNVAQATERWRQLLSRSDGTEPWLQIATAEFTRMGQAAEAPATLETPPPMVEAMVAQLAARLANEGGSADEWARLVRSHTVLGDREAAKAAVDAALKTLDQSEAAAFRAAPDVAEYLK
ncbi:MAG: c-type cytochrome biogenesis protein CcmI [Pseudomonadota bacterium]